MPRSDVVRAIEAEGAIAVLRLDDPARLRPVVDALAAGGVRTVELTMTMPGALKALAALCAAAGASDRLMVGVGSVLDTETARLAILEGARFVVAPSFQPALVEMCHRYDVVAMPGGLTPTEILAAWQAGADLVKLFPAGRLGPAYLQDLLGPLPQVKLVPTGGVSADNVRQFLAAGAAAVGVGGTLVPRDVVARGDYAQITQNARRLWQAIHTAREGRADG